MHFFPALLSYPTNSSIECYLCYSSLMMSFKPHIIMLLFPKHHAKNRSPIEALSTKQGATENHPVQCTQLAIILALKINLKFKEHAL